MTFPPENQYSQYIYNLHMEFNTLSLHIGLHFRFLFVEEALTVVRELT